MFTSREDSIGNNVVIVKLGGSSITHKGTLETLNREALTWVVQTIASTIDSDYTFHPGQTQTHSNHDTIRPNFSFILVHGAGSYGHLFAKEYGLQGKTQPPSLDVKNSDETQLGEMNPHCLNQQELRRTFHGLAKTRASVQKLNNLVVSYLIDAGINAIGLSPCMTYANLQAHGGNEHDGGTALVSAILQSLKAGLVPVLHGDAGLWGDFSKGRISMGAGILSGDTLLEVIATHSLMKPHLSRAIFLTDVDGVYTRDPKLFSDAELLKVIEIDGRSGHVITNVIVSGSTHEHDVTGGLMLKLGSAAVMATKCCIDVIIVKCQSKSAEQVLLGLEPDAGTVVRMKKGR